MTIWRAAVTEEHGFQPTCVIAGAGPGLGLAIAERYAEEGFAAFMLCRRPEVLEAPVVKLQERALRVIPLECDVTSSASVNGALRDIRHLSGGCDVLVYNAFADNSGGVSTLDPDTMLKEFRVNVAGALAFVNLTLNEMRSRGGTILFSGCGLARVPSAERASLSVGKAALRALVECLADEVEPEGVRVGMVSIDGSMPLDSSQLREIAELYWHQFIVSERDRKRELRFHPQTAIG